MTINGVWRRLSMVCLQLLSCNFEDLLRRMQHLQTFRRCLQHINYPFAFNTAVMSSSVPSNSVLLVATCKLQLLSYSMLMSLKSCSASYWRGSTTLIATTLRDLDNYFKSLRIFPTATPRVSSDSCSASWHESPLSTDREHRIVSQRQWTVLLSCTSHCTLMLSASLAVQLARETFLWDCSTPGIVSHRSPSFCRLVTQERKVAKNSRGVTDRCR